MSSSDEENQDKIGETDQTQHYRPTEDELSNVIELDDFRRDYENMRPGLLSRTRLTIAAAALFFIALILIPALSPLGELLPSNGLTRTDVGKFRVDIFETPSLKRIANRMTTLNSTVVLEQLGWSSMFRAYDEHNHHAYFELTKSDFVQFQVGENGSLPKVTEKTISHFSTSQKDGKVFVLKNDRELAQVTGITNGASEQWNSAPLIFNYGRSAILYRYSEESQGSPAVAYIADLNRPSAVLVPEFQSLETVSADRFGKQLFGLSRDTVHDTALTQRKLVGANFDYKPPAVATFETGVLMETELFHCGPAAALALVDAEKLRIISARNGEPRAVYYFKEIFDQTQSKPDFEILPGVPAAILGDRLIDMRSGKIVDRLRNFSKPSALTVDYKNQILYYSSNEKSGQPTASYMTVNVYDLDKVSLVKQVALGPQSMRAPVKKETTDVEEQRLDNIRQLFITEDGKLVVLTSPADEAGLNRAEPKIIKSPELTLRARGYGRQLSVRQDTEWIENA
jgi:hypothetical protein